MGNGTNDGDFFPSHSMCLVGRKAKKIKIVGLKHKNGILVGVVGHIQKNILQFQKSCLVGKEKRKEIGW